MNQTHAQQVKQSLGEVQAIRQRLGTPEWREEDWWLIDGMLASYERLLQAFLEAQSSLKRLMTLLFGKRHRRKSSAAGRASASVGATVDDRGDVGAKGEPFHGVDLQDESGARSAPDTVQTPPKGGHRPGYGRLGADAYAGAERVECRHEALAAGQICPVCGQGRLYGLPPGVEMRIDGNALLSAIRYELEKLRCSACGEVFTAKLPRDAPVEKYSARARAVLAVGATIWGCRFTV